MLLQLENTHVNPSSPTSYLLNRIGKLTLNSCQPNTSRRSMHQDPIPLLDPCPHHQRAITRRRSDKQARRLVERPPLGHGKQRRLLCAEPRRKGALLGAKDARSRWELGVLH